MGRLDAMRRAMFSPARLKMYGIVVAAIAATGTITSSIFAQWHELGLPELATKRWVGHMMATTKNVLDQHTKDIISIRIDILEASADAKRRWLFDQEQTVEHARAENHAISSDVLWNIHEQQRHLRDLEHRIEELKRILSQQQ